MISESDLDFGNCHQIINKRCSDYIFNNNYLSKEDYKFLKLVSRKPGTMNGLRKVYKYN